VQHTHTYKTQNHNNNKEEKGGFDTQHFLRGQSNEPRKEGN